MSGETRDPSVDPSRSSDPLGSGPVSPDAAADQADHHERPAPLAPYSSNSGDELNALLTESIVEPDPDPFLGAFNSGETPAASSPPQSTPVPDQADPAPVELDLAFAPVSDDDSSSSSADSLAKLDEPPSVEPSGGVGGTSVGSFDALGALAALTEQEAGPSADGDVVPLPAALVVESPRVVAPTAEKDDDEEDEEDDDSRGRRRSWFTILLLSYASAVTLGLIWVLTTGRRLNDAADLDFAPASANQADPGRRADQSRVLAPPQPLAADHLTELGKPVRLGSLEATPLEIRLGGVELQRAFGADDRRDGGSNALRLTLRLKNVSTDAVFVPLDEAFIRERVAGSPDSFIETGDRVSIPMYPLAVASERTIVGQEFKELQPGQSYDAEVVSETAVADRLTAAMTWRVRLRTGVGRTDTLGVRFRRDQVH